jgi:hypothetical protein
MREIRAFRYFRPGKSVSEVVLGRQRSMQVLGVSWYLPEAGVVVGQKARQELVGRRDRADTLKAKLLDQTILQGLVGTFDATLRLKRVGAKDIDVERV